MSPEEKAKADEIYKAIIGKERNTLVKRYGKDAEKVAKGRAVKQAQKLAEKKMNSSKDKLREMVKSALMGTNEELKGGQKKLDVAEPKGKITAADFAMLRKGKLKEYDPDQAQLDDEIEIPMSYDDEGLPLGLGEDLDLGHTDNEPHMIKGELYRIGKYAMELYQMVDQFEGMGEVDFPAWWQSKITTAKNMVSSAKHYLEFELKEPEVDAMVGVAAAEDIIPNVPTKPLEGEIEENLEETRVNPNTNDRVNYLAHTLEYIWNMSKGNNSIDFNDLAKSIVGDMFGDDEDEIEEGNLGHNELASLEPEGRFWIVTYRTMDGKKEKVFTDEDEARAFMNTTLEESIKEAQEEVIIDGKPVRISSIEVSNIYPDDYPDFSDAYASNAQFMDGTELTDEQLAMLDDQYSYLIRNAVEDYLTEKKLTKPELKKSEETLAQRIAKKLKEDVVKGSNIKKDSKGKWRVLSGKTGKMWPQTYNSKADAEDALQAYHATKG